MVETITGKKISKASKKARPDNLQLSNLLKDFGSLSFLERQNSWQRFKSVLFNLMPTTAPGYWFADLENGEAILILNPKTKETYIIVGSLK